MKDLQARKRALAAESEVYRQTLKLELQNLRLYGMSLKRKVTKARASSLALAAGAPLLWALLFKRRRSKLGLASAAVTAWNLYRKFAPLFRGFFAQSEASGQRASARPADGTLAGNI